MVLTGRVWVCIGIQVSQLIVGGAFAWVMLQQAVCLYNRWNVS